MKEHELREYAIFFGYCLFFCRVVLLITCIKYFSFVRKSSFQILIWYSLFSFIIALFELSLVWLVGKFPDELVPILKKYDIKNTFFISPFYYLNEIIGYGLLFSNLLKKEIGKKIYSATICLFVFEVVNTIFIEGYKDAQVYGSLLFSFWGIFLACLYFSEISKGNFNRNIFKTPSFFISVAIFVSNSLSIFIYVMTNSLFKDDTILYYKISIFRMIVEMLCFLLMSYGIWILKADNFERKLKIVN